MIEILKSGTKKKCTCKECGCIFTYEDEDVKGKIADYFANDYTYINCPQCNNEIRLVGVK